MLSLDGCSTLHLLPAKNSFLLSNKFLIFLFYHIFYFSVLMYFLHLLHSAVLFPFIPVFLPSFKTCLVTKPPNIIVSSLYHPPLIFPLHRCPSTKHFPFLYPTPLCCFCWDLSCIHRRLLALPLTSAMSKYGVKLNLQSVQLWVFLSIPTRLFVICFLLPVHSNWILSNRKKTKTKRKHQLIVAKQTPTLPVQLSFIHPPRHMLTACHLGDGAAQRWHCVCHSDSWHFRAIH